MKLFSKLAVAFLFVVALVSCSKDEEQPVVEQPSLVGKWTFEKQVYFDGVGDPSKYMDYVHGCTTTKDSRIFASDDTVVETYYNSGCDGKVEKYTFKWGWKEAGKKIFIQDMNYEIGSIYEVLQLDATTLKLKWIQSYGTREKSVSNKEMVAYNYYIMKRS